MNFRLIGKYLSYLIITESVFLFVPILVSAIYGEFHNIPWLLLTAAICGGAGLFLFLTCRKESATIYPRESFVVAGSGWVLVSIFGALPFVFTKEIPHFIDALFESVSGFTTSGGSILSDVESMSRGLLFWRSFTHWLGGIGILVFILTIVRGQRGNASSSMNLLKAETTGPQVGKLMPKTQESVRMLYIIYISLSVIFLIFLLAGDMPFFEAICTMFSTAGTGGFAVLNDSFASYSAYLQIITAIFMTIFGVNFTLYYFLVKGERKSVFKDEELHLYLGILIATSVFITFFNYFNGHGANTLGTSFRESFFTVSSIMTSTGFAVDDFNLWPEISRIILVFLMIAGAMAGSTAGGLKTARLLILGKSMRDGMYRLTHPRSVRSVRINDKPLNTQVVQGTYLFLCFYCLILMVSVILISLEGLPLETNITAVVACFNNSGPGLDQVGPYASYALYSSFSKVVLILNMLLGRLEIFPILLLFFPATWKRKQ